MEIKYIVESSWLQCVIYNPLGVEHLEQLFPKILVSDPHNNRDQGSAYNTWGI